MSKLEESLAHQITVLKLPAPVREYRFAAELVGTQKGVRARLVNAGLKDWRFDFAWPDLMLAAEVEGITRWGRNKNGSMKLGRHQTATGMEGDLRKYDKAMGLGWTVYRCSGSMVKEGVAVGTIELLIGRSEG